MRQSAFRLALALVVTSACTTREVSTVLPAPEAQATSVVEATRQNLDLLFVIDDSGSMKEEQESLRQRFGSFIEAVSNVEGGRPNLHVGIVSTNVGGPVGSDGQCAGPGDSGYLIAAPRVRTDCDGPDGSFFVDVEAGDGTRQTNFQGTLEDAFGCVAELGTKGCGFEQPLEAVTRALDNPLNADFVRPDSLLAIVVITDEDDCSMQDDSMMVGGAACTDYFDPVSCPLGSASSFRCFEFGVECDPDAPRELGIKASCKPRQDSPFLTEVTSHAASLRAVKAPERILVAGISGTLADPEVRAGAAPDESAAPALAPSCESAFGEAMPPIRLATFLGEFENSTLQSICESDLAPALAGVAKRIGALLGDPCVIGEVDLDPSTEALELDCTVSDIVFDGTSDVESVVPSCDAAGAGVPCWYAERDRASCADSATGIAIRVRRDGELDAGSHRTVARCSERVPI